MALKKTKPLSGWRSEGGLAQFVIQNFKLTLFQFKNHLLQNQSYNPKNQHHQNLLLD